ncbi:4527_t:CDS:2, partial [Dentiscutata erythropus]
KQLMGPLTAEQSGQKKIRDVLTSEDDDSDYILNGAEDKSPSSLLLLSQLMEFQEFYQLPVENYLHSWIIDLDDQEAEILFSVEEWNEIRYTVRKLLEVDRTFAESIIRFAN